MMMAPGGVQGVRDGRKRRAGAHSQRMIAALAVAIS